eukprot:scaffold1172_cov115-Cylindrotheca_fusiformis.AAC.8
MLGKARSKLSTLLACSIAVTVLVDFELRLIGQQWLVCCTQLNQLERKDSGQMRKKNRAPKYSNRTQLNQLERKDSGQMRKKNRAPIYSLKRWAQDNSISSQSHCDTFYEATLALVFLRSQNGTFLSGKYRSVRSTFLTGVNLVICIFL